MPKQQNYVKKTYRTSEGKIAGQLVNDVYQKVVSRQKHLMKMFNGYGIDAEIFKDLKENGCREIRITEVDTGDTYTCPIETFDEKKIVKNFQGVQYFISGKYLNHAR